MTKFSDLPSELRQIIWYFARLPRIILFLTGTQSVISLQSQSPPCWEAWTAWVKARAEADKTFMPERASGMPELRFNPGLDQLRLICGFHPQTFRSLRAAYPTINFLSLKEIKGPNCCPYFGCLFKSCNPSRMGQHQNAKHYEEIVYGTVQRVPCVVVGCPGSASKSDHVIHKHWHAKHGGKLYGIEYSVK